MFQRNMSSASSGPKNKPSKKTTMKQVASRTFYLQSASCMAYSLTLKMGAICSSEASVDFRWTTQRYIPADGTLDVLIS